MHQKLNIRTWYVENAVVANILIFVTIFAGGAAIEWIGALAVFCGHCRNSAAERSREAEPSRRAATLQLVLALGSDLTGPFAHRACSFILPGAPFPRRLLARLPRWMRERTHGCWCSSWQLTRNGLLVWRSGAWRKPVPGELRQVRGSALERYKLLLPAGGT